MPASEFVPPGVRTGDRAPDPGETTDVAPGRRAAPLAPDDRRAAILDAAIPLLRERGSEVTTRELAAAAGVAEGTLFRVFPDKAAIVQAALDRALDPAKVVVDLLGVVSDDVRETIIGAVRAVYARLSEVATLIALTYRLREGERDGQVRRSPHKAHWSSGRTHMQAVVETLTGVLEPHAEHLRQSPSVCAQMIVAVALATTGPFGLGYGSPLNIDIVADLLLDGLTNQENPC